MDFMKHFESTRYPRMLGGAEVEEGDQRPKICVIRYISKRPDYVVVVAVQNVRNICVMKRDGIFCCLARIDVAVVGGGERQYQWFIKYAKCTLLSTQLRFNGAFPSWLSTFVRWFVMEKVFFFFVAGRKFYEPEQFSIQFAFSRKHTFNVHIIKFDWHLRGRCYWFVIDFVDHVARIGRAVACSRWETPHWAFPGALPEKKLIVVVATRVSWCEPNRWLIGQLCWH